MVKKAINNIKLNRANRSKLNRLDTTADIYMELLQQYCDYLVYQGNKSPNKFQDVPQEIETVLSARWQRCCWQQACGILQSWFSNHAENPPEIKTTTIQANHNVVALEKSSTESFDYWLRISTHEKRKVIRVPVKLHRKAKKTLEKYPDLCTGVRLERHSNGSWWGCLTVNHEPEKKPHDSIVGVDVGMVWLATTSQSKHYGDISEKLVHKVEKKAKRFQRKQKLNACLTRKGLKPVDLHDHKAEAYCKNEIGRALNQLVEELPEGCAIAVEALDAGSMGFKSRQMNRRLKASQLGYLRDKLQYKLEDAGFTWEAVQPAYTSQQCSQCGFISRENRRDQAHFVCQHCGFECNADVNASLNISKRFGDHELNGLDFPKVKPLLELRFHQGFPDVCRTSAGLDSSPQGNAHSVQLKLRVA